MPDSNIDPEFTDIVLPDRRRESAVLQNLTGALLGAASGMHEVGAQIQRDHEHVVDLLRQHSDSPADPDADPTTPNAEDTE